MVTLRQFDVFANKSPRSRDTHPYFIILQSDLLEQFTTRIVAPLIAPTRIAMLERLMPEVSVGGERFVVAMPDLGPMPVHAIGAAVENLESERERLIGALDLVFTGI